MEKRSNPLELPPDVAFSHPRPQSQRDERSNNPFEPPPFERRQSVASTTSIGTILPEYSLKDPNITVPYHEHIFQTANEDPWCTLHLYSRNSIPGSPLVSNRNRKPKHPSYWGSELVTGLLEFNLKSPQTIQQISFTIKGKVGSNSMSEDSCIFLNHEVIIWSKKKILPGQDASIEIPIFDGKTSGQINMPFSFNFPTCHIDTPSRSPPIDSAPPSPRPQMNSISEQGPGTQKSLRSWLFRRHSARTPSDNASAQDTVALPRSESEPFDTSHSHMPQSISANRSNVDVDYRILLCVKHGRFKLDTKIKIPITYSPAFAPLPASLMRQEAYKMGTSIPGPSLDPIGWVMSSIQGPMHRRDGKIVYVNCKLYLAKPMSYTRGTTIPCYLELECDDSSFLEEVSTVTSPHLVLIREILSIRRIYHSNFNGAVRLQPTLDSLYGEAVSTDLHQVGEAVWWLPPGNSQPSPTSRILEGEIHLGVELISSCSFPFYSMQYFVELLSLRTDTDDMITSLSDKGKKPSQALISQPVGIATLYASEGPVPVTFSQPPRGSNSNQLNRSTSGVDSFSY